MGNIVAIVGRPNVGKSTLFNRLVRRRAAITMDEPGVTRDRLYGSTSWRGTRFTLVDTGGIGFEGDERMGELMRYQAEGAIREAVLVLFVVDARTGITPLDREAAEILRTVGKSVILVANKVDTPERELDGGEFWELGLGPPICVSAEHGINVDALLDLIVEALREKGVGDREHSFEDGEGEAVRVCVVGRPNVGKSSLVNAILNADRVIVAEEPGTTRDAVDVEFNYDGRQYVLIDTAGLRRRSRIYRRLEGYSVARSLKAIEKSHVVVLVLDAREGVARQDRRIARYGYQKGKSFVIVVNKWDLAELPDEAVWKKAVLQALDFISFAPVLFTIAIKGEGIQNIVPTAERVFENYTRRIPEPELRELVDGAILSPHFTRGKRVPRLRLARQISICPPTFDIKVGGIDEGQAGALAARVEGELRSAFDFAGTPLVISVRGAF